MVTGGVDPGLDDAAKICCLIEPMGATTPSDEDPNEGGWRPLPSGGRRFLLEPPPDVPSSRMLCSGCGRLRDKDRDASRAIRSKQYYTTL
jgi:hypothetical protein